MQGRPGRGSGQRGQEQQEGVPGSGSNGVVRGTGLGAVNHGIDGRETQLHGATEQHEDK